MVSNIHNLNPYQNFVELNHLLFLTDEKNKNVVDSTKVTEHISHLYIPNGQEVLLIKIQMLTLKDRNGRQILQPLNFQLRFVYQKTIQSTQSINLI